MRLALFRMCKKFHIILFTKFVFFSWNSNEFLEPFYNFYIIKVHDFKFPRRWNVNSFLKTYHTWLRRGLLNLNMIENNNHYLYHDSFFKISNELFKNRRKCNKVTISRMNTFYLKPLYGYGSPGLCYGCPIDFESHYLQP